MGDIVTVIIAKKKPLIHACGSLFAIFLSLPTILFSSVTPSASYLLPLWSLCTLLFHSQSIFISTHTLPRVCLLDRSQSAYVYTVHPFLVSFPLFLHHLMKVITTFSSSGLINYTICFELIRPPHHLGYSFAVAGYLVYRPSSVRVVCLSRTRIGELSLHSEARLQVTK